MRRRRISGDDDHFDLLPFIAILLCTLGCLLFVTLAIGALNMGGSSDVWDPSGIRDGDKVPILVDWDGDNASVELDTGTVRIPCAIKDGSGSSDAGVQKLVDMMSERSSTSYALFVVRPTGFASFQDIAEQFRNRHLEIGKEPEPQNKKVRLGMRHIQHPTAAVMNNQQRVSLR